MSKHCPLTGDDYMIFRYRFEHRERPGWQDIRFRYGQADKRDARIMADLSADHGIIVREYTEADFEHVTLATDEYDALIAFYRAKYPNSPYWILCLFAHDALSCS